MKKSFHIFQRDLSRLLHNKAAILVLIGVCCCLLYTHGLISQPI